ncbi:MAG: TIGR02099 family protein [Gallionella sp.]|jgi:uncharacterized protein (TIGR02099 family)|nr:TIGR02099 family protein [Gallionella sp.]
MLNSLPVRLLWHSLNWLTRLAIVASAAIAVLMAIVIVVLRYWLMPDIGQHHERIVASLSTAIGSPVTIGKIAGDWQGLRPRLNLTDVRILDRQGQPALTLPRIDGSVSWLSLLTAELRLASLEIDGPELLVRRDAQGNFFIGGVALSSQGGDNGLADWLLRQSHMAVRDASIVWLDERRAAPPLLLTRVNLRIENFFGKHRFALQALPPAELSTPLDVRGNFRGESFDDLAQWRGQIYTRLDYTDVTAWRPWLDLPSEFSRGRGALRGWLGIAQGRVSEITADMDLHDVVTRLAEDVPELALLDLRGRASWKEVDGDLEVSTKRLSMRLHNGIALPPTDFYLRIAAEKAKDAGGEMRANLLQLETLSSLASFVPLDAGLRAQLDAYAPRGNLSGLNLRWQGPMTSPEEYRIAGRFDNLAVRRVGAIPGFSGLSLDVDGDEDGGNLNIDSRHLVVDAPGAMPEALSFATLTGQVGWTRKRGETQVKVDNVAVANDDLAGNLYGSYRTQKGTLGVLDLTVALTRGDVTKAYRYTPLAALDKEDNDWLKGALLAGHTEDFRVRVKGNLSDFPLDGTEDALLEIGGHARDTVLYFARDWPRIEHIDGAFWIRGNKLEVKAPTATMLGAQLQNVTIAIPDLMSEDLPLEVRGVAVASSETFLQFIQQSPVRGYIDGFTDGMSASGNGHLDLFLRVPLQGEQPVKVAGSFRAQDNDIDLGSGAPLLRDTRGTLSFTESGVSAEKIQSIVLGGPATIDVQSAEGGILHASARGRCDLDALRKSDPHPLLKRLHGSASWDADIKVVNKSAELVINSSLQGIASSLPLPFAKRGIDAMPLHVEKHIVAEGQDTVEVQLGRSLSARLLRRDENGAMAIKHGVVAFNQTGDLGKWLKKDGVWLVGRIPQLSLQGWGELQPGADDETASLPFGGADLHVDRASGFGMQVDNLEIDASARGEGLAARLSSTVLDGELEWQPRGEGKLTARLQNVVWVESNRVSGGSAQPEAIIASPGNLPALQISIENLKVDGAQVGRLDLVGHPEGRDWRLRRLSIVNPDGSLVGDGIWHSSEQNARTDANLQLQISDAGKILSRSGYPDTVKAGKGKLVANVSWNGAPQDFNYATLDGTLRLDAEKGQFLKMKPGVGKLLSVLSLQSIPKRITLDFTDVFSDGFEFDSINGNATIANGVIRSQDFRIDGSSAKVTMKGSVDLNRETQDLRVAILPTLGDSVSLLGAFAAGPAVGLGALLVNKVLGNPLDKMVSFEYNVGGTWNDPTVTKAGQAVVKPNNQK